MCIERKSIVFANRTIAGRALADRVIDECGDIENAVVLALPRGGVPVAAELAKTLHAQLDLVIVRKIGAPTQPELAVGAVASGDVLIVQDDTLRALGIRDAALREVVTKELRELHRRELLYRQSAAAVDVKNRTVILVDDGVATGATMRAAIESTRKNGAKRVIVAVPHAAPDSIKSFDGVTEQIVCISSPDPYVSVGSWYEDFDQTGDEEVITLLEENRRNIDALPATGSDAQQTSLTR